MAPAVIRVQSGYIADSAVVADEQPFELVQPGKGALDDPAVAAEAGAVLGLAPRDLRCDPEPTKLATVAG
jgi:hypothetical protein